MKAEKIFYSHLDVFISLLGFIRYALALLLKNLTKEIENMNIKLVIIAVPSVPKRTVK